MAAPPPLPLDDDYDDDPHLSSPPIAGLLQSIWC